MINAIFRPLEKWPAGVFTPAVRRRCAHFKATYSKTLDLLEREMKALNGHSLVIQLQTDLRNIRADGWPRNDATVSGPAVIVSFRAKSEDFSYPCDTFKSWQENLRAIALVLQSLRKIDRFGVTARGEQYRGFKALPAPEQRPEMSTGDAAAFLAAQVPGTSAEVLAVDRDLFDAIYRLAQKKLHPDNGGPHEKFVKLQEAASSLQKNFASIAEVKVAS